MIQRSVHLHAASTLIPALCSGSLVFAVRILMMAQISMKNLGSSAEELYSNLMDSLCVIQYLRQAQQFS